LRFVKKSFLAWTLTGKADDIFRVFCKGLSDLNTRVQQRLLSHPAIGRVPSRIVMDQLKDDTALPHDRAANDGATLMALTSCGHNAEGYCPKLWGLSSSCSHDIPL